MWLNLLTGCALDLLYQTPCLNICPNVTGVPLSEEDGAVLTEMFSSLLESIWNMGVVFFVYCLYSTRMLVDIEVKVRISPRIYREIELCFARWTLLGRYGDQGIRCWMLLLKQEALMFAGYMGNEIIQNGRKGVMSFPEDAELGSETRVALSKVVADNESLTTFAVENDILHIVNNNYHIVDSGWSNLTDLGSLVVLPKVAVGGVSEVVNPYAGHSEDGNEELEAQMGWSRDGTNAACQTREPETTNATVSSTQSRASALMEEDTYSGTALVDDSRPSVLDQAATSRLLLLLQLERQLAQLEAGATPRASSAAQVKTGADIVRQRPQTFGTSKKRPIQSKHTSGIPQKTGRASVVRVDSSSGASAEGLRLLEELEKWG